MEDQSQEPRQEKLKIKLVRPRSSGFGLKLVASVIAGGALLVWLFSDSGEDPTSALSGSTAADAVVDYTKELVDESGQAVEEMPQSGSGSLGVTQSGTSESMNIINGVAFDIIVPAGWTTESANRQMFLRKDTRVCQITAKGDFDLNGFKSKVLGKETDFESQLVEGLMEAGAGGNLEVDTTGALLSRSELDDAYLYAVRMTVTMSTAGRSKTQVGVNANAVLGDRMVRLQCMNMGGDSDEGGEMEVIGRSLAVSK